MSSDTFTEVHHFVADAAIVHDRARHNEERNGQHRKRLRGVHNLLQNRPRLDPGIDEVEIEEG